jgi:ubiquinone/menaquinone biosynthesis C-methylase UbiE
MISASKMTLSKIEYYAPFPIILISDMQICDFNIAANILFGSVIEKFKNCGFNHFLETALYDRKNYNYLFTEPHSTKQKPNLNKSPFYKNIPSYFCFKEKVKTNHLGPIEIEFKFLNLLENNSEKVRKIYLFCDIQTCSNLINYKNEVMSALNYALTWEAYAFSYDRILPKLSFYREVINRHIQAVLSHNAETVLDIGAGTGNVAIPLLRKGCTVYAIDFSRAMLDQMRSKIRQQDKDRLYIFEKDAADVSHLDIVEFDAANILLSLFDMARPYQTLANIIRQLKSGGIIVVTEPKRTFQLNPLLKCAEEELLHDGSFETLYADWARVMSINKTIDPSKRSHVFIEDIEEYLSLNNFKILKKQDSHLGNCTTIIAIKG